MRNDLSTTALSIEAAGVPLRVQDASKLGLRFSHHIVFVEPENPLLDMLTAALWCAPFGRAVTRPSQLLARLFVPELKSRKRFLERLSGLCLEVKFDIGCERRESIRPGTKRANASV